MKLRRHWLGALALCALAAACGDSSPANPPDTGVDTGRDAPDVAADAGADAPSLDAPDVADAPSLDARDAADAPPARCATDADCAGNPAGAACDVASGRCVACVASNDTCPAAQHCDGASNTCVAGCRSDEGCRAPGGDAGADGGGGEARYCDTTMHACVECARDEHCPAGMLCVGSLCAAGCTATRPCPAGQSCCAGACVDTLANVAHCGACDARCMVANGMPACVNGTCAVGMCTAPYEDCDRMAGNGCETGTLTSLAHCGACGNACAARPHTVPRCAAGRCEYACEAGWADCNAREEDGCEADLQGDPARCGACTTACNPPHGAGACRLGACAVARCDEGFADCDANPTNGCETDTRTSVSHCGGCGMACPARPSAFPGCLAGACVTSCVTGHQDCNGRDDDGCETDLRADPRNCGACGRDCAAAHAAVTCAMSACAIARCDEGYLDCNGRAADGCEVNPASDVAHCGGCGMACAAPSGTPACVRGACGVSACAAGRADCDMSPANGCETDTAADARNCGGCGTACALPNATAACAAGACRVAACAAGFADCDASPTNGCETNTRADARHCGGCGMACAPASAEGVCVAGRCEVGRCAAGFADCDASPANGCETDTRASLAHCGACGAACAARPSATAACAAGACAYTCAAGRGDCNGVPADGCEADLGADPRHCGGCGVACTTSVCAAGACQCGNGRVDAGEECDEGARNSDAPGSTCRTDCRLCGRCGDGSNGVFRPTASTTLAGGTYQFREFVVPAGVTVRVTGDEPLRVYAQSLVEVAGTLDLAGAGGANGVCGNDPGGAGGAGGGGGGRPGGRGGYYTGAHVLGVAGGGPGGGSAPAAPGGAGGGGGGAGYAAAGGRGGNGTCCAARLENATYPGGVEGAAYGAMDIAALQGGSGGGGGAFGGADNGTGGGGGGGGGAVLVIAPTIRVSGRINASGGAGGRACAAYDGGGGGGGSGGAVWLRATTVTITGAVEALGGAGGVTDVGGTCCVGGAGGRGADGRVRVDAVTVTGETRPAAFRGTVLCRGAVCGG